MKAIIIEDEMNVRMGFKKMIETFVPSVQVIGEADCVKDGYELIQKSNFDVLFLDIKLPDGTGFDLLNKIDNRDFSVIFVTAYDDYAIDAFRVSATDYLMKPVSVDELKNAINSVQIYPRDIQEAQKEIWNAARQESARKEKYDTNQKIILKEAERVKLIPVRDVLYCKAEGSYTSFFLMDKTSITTSINLKEYERMLGSYGFYRVHHSYLVSLLHIKSIEKQDGTILLSNDIAVPLSLRKRGDLLKVISNRFIG